MFAKPKKAGEMGRTQVCDTAGGRRQGLEGGGGCRDPVLSKLSNQEPLMHSPHPWPRHTAWTLTPYPGLDCSLGPCSFASPANPCHPTPAPPAVVTPHLNLALPASPKPRLGSGFDL